MTTSNEHHGGKIQSFLGVCNFTISDTPRRAHLLGFTTRSSNEGGKGKELGKSVSAIGKTGGTTTSVGHRNCFVFSGLGNLDGTASVI